MHAGILSRTHTDSPETMGEPWKRLSVVRDVGGIWKPREHELRVRTMFDLIDSLTLT